jgi:anti-sigma B factor antagonist
MVERTNPEEQHVSITLNMRRVGAIVVIGCGGRIVGGSESDDLQRLIGDLLPLEPNVVLNLAQVTYLDSAGIGVLVRLLHRTRNASGDLKLCAVPPRIAEVLRITKLTGVFDVHPGEDEAIAAFYSQSRTGETRTTLGRDVLCVDDSADVLAYVCEVLREAGYRVMPCGNVADVAVLLKVSPPRALVIGASARARLDSVRAAQQAVSSMAILELPGTFSTHDPVESSRELLARLRELVGEAV